MTAAQRQASRAVGALLGSWLYRQGLAGQWAIAVLLAIWLDSVRGWGRWRP